MAQETEVGSDAGASRPRATTASEPRPPWRPRFRPDIQGLRAIAVLLVVACHAGLGLPAGFIGVDVFFVVSGFVITGELLAELTATGSVRLRDFYARRARRLLPTLAVVMTVTLAVGAVVLNPFGPQVLGLRTAGAATGFVANVYLYRHVGYFDSWLNNRNPFLHLWSLSVEEQFYLVLPAFLLVAWRVGARASGERVRRRRVTLAVSAAAVGSFVLAWMFTSGRPPLDVQAPVRLAFYGAPTRVWEFALGAVLALAGTAIDRVPPRLALASAAIGAGLLVAWSVVLDPVRPFPGLTAVPPVLAAGLLIVAGASSTLVARALAVGPLRWIGDRSYSWYLWHWPAIVFARQLWPDSGLAPFLAAAGSLVLAAATYRLFEDRLRRDRSLIGRRALVLTVACVATMLLALGLTDVGIRAGWGLHEPLGWYDHPYGQDNGCVLFNRDIANHWLEATCTTRVAHPNGLILVLGDAEADSVSSGLLVAAHRAGFDVAEWARDSCPYLSRAPVGFGRCGEWQRDAMAAVARLHPALVVIANRAPDYVDDLRDDTTIAAPDGGRPGDGVAARRSWTEALDATLTDLDRRSIPAIVVASGPDFGNDFPRDRFSLAQPSLRPPTIARSEVERRREPITALERAVVARHTDASWIDPLAALCFGGSCPSMARGAWLYEDRADLTATGARRLAPAFARVLAALPRKT